MRVRKPSLLTRLRRQLSDVETKRDSIYNEYMNDIISYEDFLNKEVLLAIKEKNLTAKIENVRTGKPELGYGFDIDPHPINNLNLDL